MAKIFWAANAQTHAFKDRLVAARAGHFDAMSLFPQDVKVARSGGESWRSMREQLADHGLRIEVIDPLTRWLPGWTAPSSWRPEDVAFTAFSEDEVFEMASELGARAINVVEPFGHPVSLELGREHFARLCDRARPLGLEMVLEAMPFSGIPKLSSAWAIVSAAAKANGRLTFDAWHYLRAGEEPEVLATIPGDKIGTVQFADGSATPSDDNLLVDLYRRLPPGEGGLPLRRIAATLRRRGMLRNVGVEVFGPALTSLPPMEIGRIARETLASLEVDLPLG